MPSKWGDCPVSIIGRAHHVAFRDAQWRVRPMINIEGTDSWHKLYHDPSLQ